MIIFYFLSVVEPNRPQAVKRPHVFITKKGGVSRHKKKTTPMWSKHLLHSWHPKSIILFDFGCAAVESGEGVSHLHFRPGTGGNRTMIPKTMTGNDDLLRYLFLLLLIMFHSAGELLDKNYRKPDPFWSREKVLRQACVTNTHAGT